MRVLNAFIIGLIACSALGQQLPQYSQYQFNMYSINPAFAGSTNSWEATSTFRYQWVGLLDAPRTFTLSAHGPFKNRKMGMGGLVYSDIVGPTRRVGAQVSYSYHFRLSEKIKLGLSASFGFIQWLVDGSKITTHDPGDNVLNGSLIKTTNPDAKFGLWLHHPNWYFGVSLPQILQNKMEFYNAQNNSLNVMEDHYFVNGGYIFEVGEDWKLEPSVMFKYVYPIPPKLDVNFRTTWKDMLWLSAGYRTNDAVNVMLGYEYREMLAIGYSYDITTTPLRNYSSGTHEVFMRIKFAKYPEAAKPESAKVE